MNTTWKQLAEQISQMTEEQQGTDVTLYIAEPGEVFGIDATLSFANDDNGIAGILDEEHPFITIR